MKRAREYAQTRVQRVLKDAAFRAVGGARSATGLRVFGSAVFDGDGVEIHCLQSVPVALLARLVGDLHAKDAFASIEITKGGALKISAMRTVASACADLEQRLFDLGFFGDLSPPSPYELAALEALPHPAEPTASPPPPLSALPVAPFSALVRRLPAAWSARRRERVLDR
jgi:hypothetical protein